MKTTIHCFTLLTHGEPFTSFRTRHTCKYWYPKLEIHDISICLKRHASQLVASRGSGSAVLFKVLRTQISCVSQTTNMDGRSRAGFWSGQFVPPPFQHVSPSWVAVYSVSLMPIHAQYPQFSRDAFFAIFNFVYIIFLYTNCIIAHLHVHSQIFDLA